MVIYYTYICTTNITYLNDNSEHCTVSTGSDCNWELYKFILLIVWIIKISLLNNKQEPVEVISKVIVNFNQNCYFPHQICSFIYVFCFSPALKRNQNNDSIKYLSCLSSVDVGDYVGDAVPEEGWWIWNN